MGGTPVRAVSARVRGTRVLGQMMAAGMLVAGLSVAVATPAGASGSTWYASPDGTGSCATPVSPCSLTTALADASNGDAIDLLAGTYSDGGYVDATSVTIEPAPGVLDPVLDDPDLNGDVSEALLFVAPGVTTDLIGVTLTTDNSGTGILNEGTLSVQDSTIANNEGQYGGGIGNGLFGTLSVVDSTIVGNAAPDGGGIDNYGSAIVDDSTISGNSASGGQGGGIFNPGGTMIVEASTITGNSAVDGGGGVADQEGSVTLAASIVATPGGEPSGSECIGPVTDGGYNVDDDGTCGFSSTGSVSHSLVIDDYLGVLGSYGGPTQTVPLLPLPSPATTRPDPALGAIPGTFDLPDGTDACGGADQRGVTLQAPCDMGAFELTPTDLTLTESAPSSSPGISVTYTATISPVPDGGTVAFSDGVGTPASSQCRTQPVQDGVATCTVNEGAGDFAVDAVYSGDTDFAPSSAGPITETVGTVATPTVNLALSENRITYGKEGSVEFKFIVTGPSSDGHALGTVTVYDSGTVLCTGELLTFLVALPTGVCSLSAKQLAAGTYSDIYARYNPAVVSSSNSLYYYRSVNSAALTLTVTRVSTTTTVGVSPTSVDSGGESAALFTVNVSTGAADLSLPGGEEATVHIGSTVTCTAMLYSSVDGGSGTCRIAGNALGPACGGGGTHSSVYQVVATYSGDANFDPSPPSIPGHLTVVSTPCST
jgi:Bacterial Ig-like domain (group 3)